MNNFLVFLNCKIKAAAVLCALLSLSACQILPPVDISKSMSVEIPGSSVVKPPLDEEEADALPKNEMPATPSFSVVPPYQGSDSVRHVLAEESLSFSKTEKVHVAVDEMLLPDFIHYIFGDVFAVNYIVDAKVKSLKDPITLNLQENISKHRLFGLVVDLLKKHGVSAYSKEGIFYLWKGGQKGTAAVGIGSTPEDVPVTAGEIKQIVPVHYADAQNLYVFLPKNAGLAIISSAKENVLIMTGTRDKIIQTLITVNLLDLPAMRGRYIAMLRLDNWSPDKMVKKLGEILKQEGIPVSQQAGSRGVYFNTLERWNKVLVFSAEQVWLDRIRHWAEILDVRVDKDEEEFFLFFPENTKATELGESLSHFLDLSAGATDSKQVVAKGGGQEFTKKQNKDNSKKNKQKNVKKKTSSVLSNQSIHTVIDNKIRLSVDKNRNVIIIYTTPTNYRPLEKLLRKLDIQPIQVLIEATIAEVTLKDNLQYGVEWYYNDVIDGANQVIRTLDGLALGGGGFNYSIISGNENFKMFINALAEDDLIKILSSPRLTVRDGKTATMNVGTEVPITTSEATTSQVVQEGDSGIIRSVEYRSTGISLTVTPTVHAENVVSLEINQVVSEAQTNNTSAIDSPIILNRSVTTEVIASDGQTVLLAGLIRDSESVTVTKVPILGDIPWIGNLFRTNSQAVDRTELVIMITPTIIRSTKHIDDMNKAIFESFEFIDLADGTNE